MTQIRVILTKSEVFVTFYKTCHFQEKYTNNREYSAGEGDRYNDEATVCARALAFSLATRSVEPNCKIDNFTDREFTKDDLFAYLRKCHGEPELSGVTLTPVK